ncbi:hypothetical protein TH61_16435 [Rufibacter sp. DG15C]|uniref:hypothetical protein n=1 Tax=Rufibacter sp. DG15C TaxID=1379909 RepID=UPI00078DAD54|nr:hypothetical protein [Rufibacter sp. DG15C]AMM52457.1 hypothetical protein TH61_16435 [Rufibacter sp. DG15C]
MTDQEFDIIDELYFVTPFLDLQEKVGLPEDELTKSLVDLISKGYVKCLFPDQDTEVPFEAEHFQSSYTAYFFLATKSGLLAHNTIV